MTYDNRPSDQKYRKPYAAHNIGEYPHIFLGEALNMATDALRAQQPPPNWIENGGRNALFAAIKIALLADDSSTTIKGLRRTIHAEDVINPSTPIMRPITIAVAAAAPSPRKPGRSWSGRLGATMKPKPILFNTEMVRAILEGRKTVTRRAVKPQPPNARMVLDYDEEENSFDFLCGAISDGLCIDFAYTAKVPYRPGDLLYVRETFRVDYLSNIPGAGRIQYKADGLYRDFSFAPSRYDMMRRAQLKPGWRPNENMPREAARIFLRVTGVRVEQLQDITDEEARKEGCAGREDFRRVWYGCYSKPHPVKGEDGTIEHYVSYPWENVQETRTYRGKPWYVTGNPWVFPIEFERISKEEAYDNQA